MDIYAKCKVRLNFIVNLFFYNIIKNILIVVECKFYINGRGILLDSFEVLFATLFLIWLQNVAMFNSFIID